MSLIDIIIIDQLAAARRIVDDGHEIGANL
jgi:hypothetical protein